MQLTKFTDYCLRVLIYAALRQDGPITIDEVAGNYGISRHHVTKVVYRLGQLGYLETSRGKGGGIRLGRRPELIVIGRVIRDTEEDLGLVECLQDKGSNCVIEPACLLKSAMTEALDAFLAVLDRYTLADLIGPKRMLAATLGISPESLEKQPDSQSNTPADNNDQDGNHQRH
ncbi:Rrf2 family transcriptional regulator [Aestuariispira ectoiniformans]|uniref:Rrf2 family transcriptional regulator n=1 Tax=Aestuariispira ectoiniformans TaxID=2775080 RepID=UPI0028830DDB|nr:Rrf2 family transcriptional regulator [Aestuariispira ectoiniformans]